MPGDWSQLEVEAIVTDYFVMLEKDLRGVDYNKAEHNRALQNLIPQRTRGSIEKKHQNISAILWQLGYPYIDGYKPLPRYQKLLRTVVEARLQRTHTIDRLVEKKIETPAPPPPPIRDFKDFQVPPPKPKEVKELVNEGKRQRTRFIRRNYLEAEARNQSLGRAGEEFVLKYEHERLWRAGKRRLAERVEHIAETKGDYAGFDILSFELNGRDRLIEVKTTRFGSLSRFFASSSEVEFSEQNKYAYFLYRLFNFEKHLKFFILAGSLRKTCQLKTAAYSAVPN